MMKPTASQEMSRTPRTPKCSLMTSVMMNTTGQSITPAVNDSEPLCPNRRQSNGAMPSVSSSAKILTPTNSAIRALVMKRPASARKRRASREATIAAAGSAGAAPIRPAGSARLMLPPGRDYTRRRTDGRYNPPLARNRIPMDQALLDRLESQTAELASAGLFKRERVIASPQDPVIRLEDGREVLNFCANNYLGLANHPAIVARRRTRAHRPLRLRHGLGALHLRHADRAQAARAPRCRRFLGTEDTILYSSCFDANGGLFETMLGEEDAVISDALNHASIIDGIRLCKAQRLRYANRDLGRARGSGSKDAQDCAHAADRHRRRVLDGRQHRAARATSATWRTLRRAGDGGRLARHRLHGRRRPRHARALRRRWAASTSSPARSARRSAARSGGYISGRRSDHRLAAPALAALPVLEQHPPVVAAATLRGPRPARVLARTCADSSSENAALVPRRHARPPASSSCRASTRSSR